VATLPARWHDGVLTSARTLQRHVGWADGVVVTSATHKWLATIACRTTISDVVANMFAELRNSAWVLSATARFDFGGSCVLHNSAVKSSAWAVRSFHWHLLSPLLTSLTGGSHHLIIIITALTAVGVV
jgi:hypothetical protein